MCFDSSVQSDEHYLLYPKLSDLNLIVTCSSHRGSGLPSPSAPTHVCVLPEGLRHFFLAQTSTAAGKERKHFND